MKNTNNNKPMELFDAFNSQEIFDKAVAENCEDFPGLNPIAITLIMETYRHHVVQATGCQFDK